MDTTIKLELKYGMEEGEIRTLSVISQRLIWIRNLCKKQWKQSLPKVFLYNMVFNCIIKSEVLAMSHVQWMTFLKLLARKQ